MFQFCVERCEEEEMEEGPSTRRIPTPKKKQKRGVEPKKKEKSGISVTLMNPDVLDCSVCMEHLLPPVFQCDSGHIACSPCCSKLCNKCPSCSMPIGYNRCLAIEKFIESIKVSCEFKPYGCGETLAYMQKQTHEEMCMYAPCMCPMSDCDFRGSSKQLSRHYRSKHWSSAKPFQYNCPFSVSFGKLEEYLVLQVEEDGPLFVLKNQIELNGNAITVVCLRPSFSNEGFSYYLESRRGGSSLRLQSHAKCVKKKSEASCTVDFLLVPFDLDCSSGDLKLEICIGSTQESERVRCPSFLRI